MITWSRGPGSSYIAEGVRPVTRWVDVAGRGRAVPVSCRGVRDDGGLARVTGADPDHSWMYHTHRYIDTVDKSPELVWETSRKNLLLVCWVCTSNTKQRRDWEAEQMREPTLSVRGVSVVEGLLALTDGGSERQVSLHHPLLTPVHHGLRRHGQWVAFRYVFCQGG